MKQAFYGLVALFLTVFMVSFAFAQDASTTTIAVMTSTTIPAWVAKGNSILDLLAANKSVVGVVVAILLDLVMRMVKTQEPKSLLYMISSAFKLIAKAFDMFSGFLDQYIQRLK